MALNFGIVEAIAHANNMMDLVVSVWVIMGIGTAFRIVMSLLKDTGMLKGGDKGTIKESEKAI